MTIRKVRDGRITNTALLAKALTKTPRTTQELATRAGIMGFEASPALCRMVQQGDAFRRGKRGRNTLWSSEPEPGTTINIGDDVVEWVPVPPVSIKMDEPEPDHHELVLKVLALDVSDDVKAPLLLHTFRVCYPGLMSG